MEPLKPQDNLVGSSWNGMASFCVKLFFYWRFFIYDGWICIVNVNPKLITSATALWPYENATRHCSID